MHDPWRANVPALFRALAGSDPLDRFPRPRTGALDVACGSWGALHYAFSCLLGWDEIGRGLAWWYAAGQPVEDSEVLACVKAVWGEDDLVDYYAAWAWKPASSGWLTTQANDPLHGPSPSELARTSLWPDEDWWRAFVRRGQVHHHDPFYGGTDPLHLSVHTGREDGTPSSRPIIYLRKEARHVVLVTEGLDHWLADLDALGASLPPLGDRSWHVEVFDRTIGDLGEYRRSRVTGRWFRGKHAIHLCGARIPG